MEDTENPLWQALRRGALGRCPNCGHGALFRAYLKPVETCAACRESFAHISADDGPAWLTILVVGHIVVALALITETHAHLSVWLSVSLFAGLSVAMVLALIQPAKGIFVAAIWATKAREARAE